MCPSLSAFTVVRFLAKFVLRWYINTNSDIAYSESLKIKAAASRFQLSESCEQVNSWQGQICDHKGQKQHQSPFLALNQQARLHFGQSTCTLLLQKYINSALQPFLNMYVNLHPIDNIQRQREHYIAKSVWGGVYVKWFTDRRTARENGISKGTSRLLLQFGLLITARPLKRPCASVASKSV